MVPTSAEDRIERGIAHLFSLVIEALSAGTHALLAGDHVLAQRVVDADAVIDELASELDHTIWAEIDETKGSAELRPLIGMLLMLTEMERSADLAEHVARRALSNLGAEMTPLSRGIVERMSEVALAMWQAAADAFTDRSARAVQLDDADDDMDLLFARLSVEIDSGAMPNTFATQVTMLARFYERLGDHAVNVARRIEELPAHS